MLAVALSDRRNRSLACCVFSEAGVCEAAGLAAEGGAVGGRDGAEVEKVLQKAEAAPGFSVCHEGVGPVLSGAGVHLETGVFVGKGLRGEVEFVGACNLKQVS